MIDKPIGYLLDGQFYKTMQFRKDGGAYEGQTAVFATGANANPDQHPAFAFRECDDSHAGEPVAWKHDCAALLTSGVELWIDACPHCGRPRTAQPPQKPFTYYRHHDGGVQDLPDENTIPLYTSPPASTATSEDVRLARKPLTGEQIQDLYFDGVVTLSKIHDFARAVEAAHGIKDTP